MTTHSGQRRSKKGGGVGGGADTAASGEMDSATQWRHPLATLYNVPHVAAIVAAICRLTQMRDGDGSTAGKAGEAGEAGEESPAPPAQRMSLGRGDSAAAAAAAAAVAAGSSGGGGGGGGVGGGLINWAKMEAHFLVLQTALPPLISVHEMCDIEPDVDLQMCIRSLPPSDPDLEAVLMEMSLRHEPSYEVHVNRFVYDVSRFMSRAVIRGTS